MCYKIQESYGSIDYITLQYYEVAKIQTRCDIRCKMALIFHLSLYPYSLPCNFVVPFYSNSSLSYEACFGQQEVSKCEQSEFQRCFFNWSCLLLHLCYCYKNMPGLDYQRKKDMWCSAGSLTSSQSRPS